MSLPGQSLEFVPGFLIDFRADFYTLHTQTMIDKTRNVKIGACMVYNLL